MPDAAQSFDVIEFTCATCGYILHGIDSARCPECGTLIRRDLHSTRIPWELRSGRGIVRGFFQTIWQIFRLSGRLHAASDQAQVSYRSAQGFRWIVIGLLALPVTLAWVGLQYHTDFLGKAAKSLNFAMVANGPGGDTELGLVWARGFTLTATFPAGSLLFLVLVTGLPSYCFHPRRLAMDEQNRAVALSYYASGTLLLWDIALLLAGLTAWIQWENQWGQGRMHSTQWLLFSAAWLTVGSTAVATVLINWLTVLRFHSTATGCSWRGWLAMLLIVPLIWIFSAAVCFGAMPWLVGVVYSIAITGFN